MKIKFLSIAFAFVVALALVSCKTEAPKPTGDVEKDVKALTEYIQKVDVKDAKAYEEATKVAEEFTKYYSEGEGKDKAKEWGEAYAKEAKKALEKLTDEAAKAAASGASGEEKSSGE